MDRLSVCWTMAGSALAFCRLRGLAAAEAGGMADAVVARISRFSVDGVLLDRTSRACSWPAAGYSDLCLGDAVARPRSDRVVGSSASSSVPSSWSWSAGEVSRGFAFVVRRLGLRLALASFSEHDDANGGGDDGGLAIEGVALADMSLVD